MRLSQPHPQRISPKGFMHEAQTRNGVLCVLSGKKVLGSSSRPFVDQKEVAVAVLRGPSWTERSCRSPWPSVSSVNKRCCRCSSSRSFVALRGQKEVAVLRGPPCPLWTKGGAVAVLRGPSWPFVDRKKLPLQLPFSVALRVLCGQKVLPLQFFVSLRRQNKLQHSKCHQERSVQDFPQSPYSLQLRLMSIPSETKIPRASQKPRRRPPSRVNRPR